MSSVRHRLPVGPSKGSSGGGWPSRNLSSMRTPCGWMVGQPERFTTKLSQLMPSFHMS